MLSATSDKSCVQTRGCSALLSIYSRIYFWQGLQTGTRWFEESVMHFTPLALRQLN